MSKICEITGKTAMNGNNVSHSKRRTKRTFDVNLFTKKFYWPEQDITGIQQCSHCQTWHKDTPVQKPLPYSNRELCTFKCGSSELLQGKRDLDMERSVWLQCIQLVGRWSEVLDRYQDWPAQLWCKLIQHIKECKPLLQSGTLLLEYTYITKTTGISNSGRFCASIPQA